MKLKETGQTTKKVSPKNKIINKIFLAIATFILAVVVGYLFWQPASEKLNTNFAGKQWFEKIPLLTNVYRIFDLGVVDVNSNGYLDVFTSNHNHGQYLLLNNGEGNFSANVTSDWGLDQDRYFPGLEYAGTQPEIDRSGLYIYWKERNLIIQNNSNSIPVSGTIDFFAGVKVKQQQGFDVKTDTTTIDTGAEASKIEFSSNSDNGIFNFNPGNVSLPISIQINEDTPLDNIYIGDRRLNPDSHEFGFFLRDRHGMAWTDIDRSGNLDVFIVRGGLKGRIKTIPQEFNEELLISGRDNIYEETITEAAIAKKGCPALQTAWVDANTDGLLDLYTVCYRGAKDDDTQYLNQLHQQQPDGSFIEVAQQANIAFAEMGFFNWFDSDSDGDSDLFWVNDEAFWIYKNEGGIFTPEKIADNSGKVWDNFEDSTQLTLADYDDDGDTDIFGTFPTGNNLLINNGGSYQLIDPAEIGLPSTSLISNWVDYDNDGLSDLHLIPNGLYLQQPNHQFIPTGMLASRSSELLEARATWFDADNNGTRDLLLATRYEDSLFKQIYQKLIPQSIKTSMWQMTMYSNLEDKNHWLEIDLIGDENNPQAIGSQVEIVTPDSIQTAIVGQAEGSQFSQGHYRIYFGLGKQTQVDKLKIFWTDGYEEEIDRVDSDRVLTISKRKSS